MRKIRERWLKSKAPKMSSSGIINAESALLAAEKEQVQQEIRDKAAL